MSAEIKPGQGRRGTDALRIKKDFYRADPTSAPTDPPSPENSGSFCSMPPGGSSRSPRSQRIGK